MEGETAEQESRQPDTVHNQQLQPSVQRQHPEVVKLWDQWHAHCELSDVVQLRFRVSAHSMRDVGLWQELNVKLRFT